MRIFISYPNANRDIAIQVETICRTYKHEPFVAAQSPEFLRQSRTWLSALSAALDQSDLLILCLVKESVNAYFQKMEYDAAVRRKKNVIVVYSGEWNAHYADKDNFPWQGRYQRYRLDSDEGLAGLIRFLQLTPPEEERFLFMQQTVIEAGTQLLLKYGRGFLTGEPKPLDERKNYATTIDIEVQKYITKEIRKKYPADSIIAEENDSLPGVQNSNSIFTWTVDPLDGTLNFLSGDDRFCCGIGLLCDGEPFMGAIFLPSSMELYTGGIGRKAERRLLLAGTIQILNTEKDISELSDCYTLSHVNSEEDNIELCFEDEFPKRLHHAVRRVWMWGCGLVALTSIARGTHHLLVHRVTYPYDMVPGLAILHSAGGVSSIWPSILPEQWKLSKERRFGIVAACNKSILDAFFDRFSDISQNVKC